MSDGKTEKSRREFFLGIGRYLTLGLIGTGGGVIASRGRGREGQQCVNKSVCCNCATFRDCRLPAALSAREQGITQQ